MWEVTPEKISETLHTAVLEMYLGPFERPAMEVFLGEYLTDFSLNTPSREQIICLFPIAKTLE